MILGGVIKTYWAETNKIDPKKIINVSVMPCTSKKYEILRPQNKIGKMKPVDYVLTTRELAYLLKRKGIDLKTIDPEPCDDPLGEPSGAGVIYGASGGVMESAVRSAYYLMTGKSLPGLEFKPARGNKHIKKATLKLKGKEIRLVVVNGLQYAKEILDELEENPCAYHGIEVMACPGGCIGGGGQPVPINDDIRKARSKALYNIDKKSTIREAHKNPALQQVYKHYLKTKKIRHKICHTSYSPKKREVKI